LSSVRLLLSRSPVPMEVDLVTRMRTKSGPSLLDMVGEPEVPSCPAALAKLCAGWRVRAWAEGVADISGICHNVIQLFKSREDLIEVVCFAEWLTGGWIIHLNPPLSSKEAETDSLESLS
jgi:hypothetical protein